MRRGVWGELGRSPVTIDAHRRELQRSYLTLVNNKVNPPPFTPPAGAPAQFYSVDILCSLGNNIDHTGECIGAV